MKITQEHVGKKVIRIYPGVNISRTEITVLWVNDSNVLFKKGDDKGVYLVQNEEHRFEEIPPLKKYRPFNWEEREMIRGKWLKYKETGAEAQVTTIRKYFVNDEVMIYSPSIGTSSELLTNYVFLDTGLPVGVEE